MPGALESQGAPRGWRPLCIPDNEWNKPTGQSQAPHPARQRERSVLRRCRRICLHIIGVEVQPSPGVSRTPKQPYLVASEQEHRPKPHGERTRPCCALRACMTGTPAAAARRQLLASQAPSADTSAPEHAPFGGSVEEEAPAFAAQAYRPAAGMLVCPLLMPTQPARVLSCSMHRGNPRGPPSCTSTRDRRRRLQFSFLHCCRAQAAVAGPPSAATWQHLPRPGTLAAHPNSPPAHPSCAAATRGLPQPLPRRPCAAGAGRREARGHQAGGRAPAALQVGVALWRASSRVLCTALGRRLWDE